MPTKERSQLAPGGCQRLGLLPHKNQPPCFIVRSALARFDKVHHPSRAEDLGGKKNMRRMGESRKRSDILSVPVAIQSGHPKEVGRLWIRNPAADVQPRRPLKKRSSGLQAIRPRAIVEDPELATGLAAVSPGLHRSGGVAAKRISRPKPTRRLRGHSAGCFDEIMQGVKGNNRVILHGFVALRPVGKGVIFEPATERSDVDAVFFGREGSGRREKVHVCPVLSSRPGRRLRAKFSRFLTGMSLPSSERPDADVEIAGSVGKSSGSY
jgi:hypothetical protein